MCGRYYRKGDKQKIAEAFHATKVDDFVLPPVRESRKKHGWEEIEKDWDFPSNLQPIKIKNKYFEVKHHSMG
jgi:hypothetical protein